MRLILILIAGSYAFSVLDNPEYDAEYFDSESSHFDPEYSYSDTDSLQYDNKTALLTSYFGAKCRNIGGKEALMRWKEANLHFTNCMDSVVNFTQFNIELDTFVKHGIFNIDYKKYCRASPKIQACASNFTSSTTACFSNSDQEISKMNENVSFQLLSYMCSQDGYKIGIFIEEGGPQCLFAHRNLIPACFSQISYIMSVENMDEMQSWNIKLCKSLKSIQNCLHNALQLCSSHMPSLIIDNLLNYLWNILPCRKVAVSETDSPIKRIAPYMTNSVGKITELLVGTMVSRGCKNNDNLKYSVQTQEASYEVFKCLTLKANFSHIGEDADDYLYARLFCRMISAMDECKLQLSKKMEYCEIDQNKKGRSYNSIFMSIFDFICSKEKDRLGELITNNGIQCALDKIQDMSQQCSLERFRDLFPDVNSNMDQIFIYGEKKCREVKRSEECIVNILNQCPKQAPGKFIHDIFNELLVLFECDKGIETVGIVHGYNKANEITKFGDFSIWILFIINNLIFSNMFN